MVKLIKLWCAASVCFLLWGDLSRALAQAHDIDEPAGPIPDMNGSAIGGDLPPAGAPPDANDRAASTGASPTLTKDDDDSDEPTPRGTFSFGLGIQIGKDQLAIVPSVGYGVLPFITFGVSGLYSKYRAGVNKELRRGGDVEMLLHVPWRFLVAPFVGGGVGYQTWKRNNDEWEEDGKSPITRTIAGLRFRLGSIAVLQLRRSWSQYVARPPHKFPPAEDREPKRFSETSVGFLLVF